MKVVRARGVRFALVLASPILAAAWLRYRSSLRRDPRNEQPSTNRLPGRTRRPPPLIQSPLDPAPRVRQLAADSLRSFAQVDTAAHAIIRTFVGQLQDRDTDIRFVATENLGWLRKNPDLVVSALASMLKQEQAEIRLTTAISLGEYGTKATFAKPALEKAAAEDSDS